MADSIDLEEAREVYQIDIGGTPINILEKGKIGFILDRGIRAEQMVVVVDPFDLSRVERSLVLSDVGKVKKFKFPIKMSEEGRTERLSSEYVDAPTREQILQLFQDSRGKILSALYSKHQIFKPDRQKELARRYDKLQRRVAQSAEQSENLRVFMNSLIEILSPTTIELKSLESVLSKNQKRVYDVLRQRDINVRVFCPKCGRITPYAFNINRLKEEVCCTTADMVVKKGSFVPEEGMLPTLLYLSGITPCVGKESNYGKKAIRILKDLGKFDRPFIMYSRKPNKTMFEEFMLRQK